MSPYFFVKYCNSFTTDSLRVVHFKSNAFDAAKFNPIRNPLGNYWIKPKGGLWTCPAQSKHSWKDFCKVEGFNTHTLGKSFQLKFHSTARIAVVDNYHDLQCLPMMKRLINGEVERVVDWETLSHYADALWLTERGEQLTRLSVPYNLYGWDCETVLIMNPKCCYQV